VKRLLIALLMALLVILQYQLWVAPDGLRQWVRLSRLVSGQREQNAALSDRNQVLAAEVRDLKQGLEAVEERARRDLGMVGAGETFYQFVHEPDDKHDARR
jgi:cell division protein FtsB